VGLKYGLNISQVEDEGGRGISWRCCKSKHVHGKYKASSKECEIV
jgi:hypothetical protein